jgi:hypothetical protein
MLAQGSAAAETVLETETRAEKSSLGRSAPEEAEAAALAIAARPAMAA